LTEDYCGVEPVTHPPDVIETRPPPVVDEDKLRQIYQRTDSAILGGKIMSIFYKALLIDILKSVLGPTFVSRCQHTIYHSIKKNVII
jgi:hypothetical protein